MNKAKYDRINMKLRAAIARDELSRKSKLLLPYGLPVCKVEIETRVSSTVIRRRPIKPGNNC